MHSNQPVKTPRSKHGVQLTGQEIQALLKDPNSPLSKDLENAIKNSILAKKAHKKAEDQYTDEKILELKIENLENELAQARKSSYEKYIAAFEAYYEQIKLAVKEAQLSVSTNPNQTSHYYTLLHSFAILTEALTVIQNELVELQNERKLLHQSDAKNKKDYGVAFDALFNNPTAPPIVIDNHAYYFDINKVPEEKRAEVIEEIQNTRAELINPKKLTEMAKILGPAHDAIVNLNKPGAPVKELANRTFLRELRLHRMNTVLYTASKQIPEDKHATRVVALLSRQATLKFIPFQAKGVENDHGLYNLDKKTDFLEKKETSCLDQLYTVSEHMKKDPSIQANPDRVTASSNAHQMLVEAMKARNDKIIGHIRTIRK